MLSAIEMQLLELEHVAADIRNKMQRTHLNVRVIWNDTLVPTIDHARRAAECRDPAARAFVSSILVALRDFDETL